VPQLWLCGEGFGFPMAVQRTEIEAGRPVRFIERQGRTVAALYEDDDAEYALLLGVLPADPKAAPEKQTFSAFEELEAVLAEAGMTFANVARTWLYEDRILDWYDDFNKARDAFFRSRHLYDGLVPASTGIGSANVWGTALATGAIAFKAKRPGSIAMKEAASPLQCTARKYGSSFSRAVTLGTADRRKLFISGTASIEPGGATARVGDPEGQLNLTIDVVGAILGAAGMSWEDATRGVMYLKRPEFLPLWEKVRRERGLESIPVQTIGADICRPDLLVEMELDAVK
jgi:enamine deaminase RidA (YjgF/YER057c/UK114 family)